jgi:hypothetical protein
MRLYRAVSYAELQDITSSGELRPGPPSYQGKWLAEVLTDAAEWGRRLYPAGDFHLIEVEVDDATTAAWFALSNLDQIGPARYAEIPDLPAIVFIGEVPVPPGGP